MREFNHSNRRLIVSHNTKRARKDENDRNEAVDKLRKKLSKNKKPSQLISNYGYKKFLKIKGESSVSLDEEKLNEAPIPSPTGWKTLFISGGRKDKISKGDIVGLLFKKGHLNTDQIGAIELKQDCAFVAVKVFKISPLLSKIDNIRLKKKKIRIKLI